ncbi:MAG: LAGLIDADG family homing endonuclease [Patescibacteria group bacterium]|nr:LAGLIDADG family homing endonuclease [Patescibacteria group bacterium]
MIHPYYITGFTDGEGCFTIYVRKDKQQKKSKIFHYFYWKAAFAINLRGDDQSILKDIQKYFNGCGNFAVSNPKSLKLLHAYGQAQWQVTSIPDLVKAVIPHFEKYPLRTKKAREFILWKAAVLIMYEARKRTHQIPGHGERKFKKITYTPEETKQLEYIFSILKTRVTGKKQVPKWINPQYAGAKKIANGN